MGTDKWQPGTQYNTGDKVAYHSATYQVIQSHRAQSDWTPDITPALFAKLRRGADADTDSDDDGKQKQKKPGDYHGGRERKDSGEYHGGRDRRNSGEYRRSGSGSRSGSRDRGGEYRHHDHHRDDDDDEKRDRDDYRRDEGRRRGSEDDDRKKAGYSRQEQHHEEHAEREGLRQNPPKVTQPVELTEATWWRDAQQRSEAYKRDGPKAPVTWVCAEGSNIPQYAIEGGHERKQPLFIARVFHDGGLHPGKAGKHLTSGCSFGYGGGEVYQSKYEVLIGDVRAVKWASPADVKGGRARAIEAGHEKSGEPLYVMQTPLEGGVQPGKVALGGAYPGARVSYGGGEREVTEFKILCYA